MSECKSECKSEWVEILDPQALHRALQLCRGDYQKALVLGIEALSGSTLRGKARKWNSRYARSRDALLRRLSQEGIPWTVTSGKNGRHILVIG